MDFESGLEPVTMEDVEMSTAFPSNETGGYHINLGGRVVLAMIYFIMAIVGIVGNVFVIMAVMLSRRLQTAMNAFVVNLAVADLLACLTFMTQAVSLLGVTMPVWLCVTNSIFNITSLGCSLFTVTLIAVNRYILITKMKHTYQQTYTPIKMGVMIGSTWLIAPVCMILASATICGVYIIEHGAGYLSWLVPILLLASLITILTCYILIFCHIKHHVAHSMASQSSSKRLDISITKNLLCVVCAFYICVLPYTAVLTFSRFSANYDAFVTPIIIFTIILNMNSVVNPIIYAMRHPIFKPIFGHMIRCQWYSIPEPSTLVKAVVNTDRIGQSLDKSRSSTAKTDETDCV